MAKNKKVLITGSTGLLGLSLIRNRPRAFDLYGGYYKFPAERLPYKQACGYHEFDIRKKEEVDSMFDKISPDILVHAASLGSVDYCENNKEQARQTNIDGSRNLIEACKRGGAFFIFISSNAVFDGENPPYGESDTPNPIDYYGRTKLRTETDLVESGIQHAVLRLMTMYGWNHPLERQNPVTWILEKLIKDNRVNIVDDIFNNHLFVDNASQAVWAAASKNKQGIYHVAGGETISRYELACRTADIFGLDKGLIRPVSSSFFPSIAPRPKNTSYRIEKTQKELLVAGMDVRTGLTLMRDDPPKEWKYDWC